MNKKFYLPTSGNHIQENKNIFKVSSWCSGADHKQNVFRNCWLCLLLGKEQAEGLQWCGALLGGSQHEALQIPPSKTPGVSSFLNDGSSRDPVSLVVALIFTATTAG